MAAEYLVSSAADIHNVIAADPSPGDTLIMSNGDWVDQEIEFAAVGSSSNPITLRAETPGEVVLSGTSISISVGNSDPSGAAYLPVSDVVIAHNTIVNTLGVLVTFDHGLGLDGRDILAENVVIANNLLSSSGSAIFEGQEGSNWTWEGNIAFGGSPGPKDGHTGIEVNQPLLIQDAQDLYRPGLTSPVIASRAFEDGKRVIYKDRGG